MGVFALRQRRAALVSLKNGRALALGTAFDGYLEDEEDETPVGGSGVVSSRPELTAVVEDVPAELARGDPLEFNHDLQGLRTFSVLNTRDDGAGWLTISLRETS